MEDARRRERRSLFRGALAVKIPAKNLLLNHFYFFMDDLDNALSKLKEVESKREDLEDDLESLTEVVDKVRAQAANLAIEGLFELLYNYDDEVSLGRLDENGTFLQLVFIEPTEEMMGLFSEFGRVVQVGSVVPSNHGRTIVKTTPPDSTNGPILDIQFSFREDPHDNLVGFLESFVKEYGLNLTSSIDHEAELERLRERITHLEKLTTLLSD